MRRSKIISVVALATSSLLILGGCGFNGLFPWIAGAGALTLLTQAR